MGVVIKGVKIPTGHSALTLKIWPDGQVEIINADGTWETSCATPVPRCEECKHWQRDWKPRAAEDGTHFCAMVGLSTSADWFCADGERNGGDEE